MLRDLSPVKTPFEVLMYDFLFDFSSLIFLTNYFKICRVGKNEIYQTGKNAIPWFPVPYQSIMRSSHKMEQLNPVLCAGNGYLIFKVGRKNIELSGFNVILELGRSLINLSNTSHNARNFCKTKKDRVPHFYQ